MRLAPQTLHSKLTEAADTIGIDRSDDVIAEYRLLGIYENIVSGDVERLENIPVEGIFDVVVEGDIIEHLSNPGAMLTGILRFCDDHTRVIITTPHAFGLPNYLRFLFGRFRDGAEHVMTFNGENMRNLLDRHGYEIEQLDMCHQVHARRYRLLFFLGSTLFKAIPKLGGTLFVVARRKKTPNPVEEISMVSLGN